MTIYSLYGWVILEIRKVDVYMLLTITHGLKRNITHNLKRKKVFNYSLVETC